MVGGARYFDRRESVIGAFIKAVDAVKKDGKPIPDVILSEQKGFMRFMDKVTAFLPHVPSHKMEEVFVFCLSTYHPNVQDFWNWLSNGLDRQMKYNPLCSALGYSKESKEVGVSINYATKKKEEELEKREKQLLEQEAVVNQATNEIIRFLEQSQQSQQSQMT
jgi:hypothetical protein